MMDPILLGLFCLSGLTILSCQSRQYHYVPDLMAWTEAQTYCRQKHTDLATVQSTEEKDQLLATVPSHYKSDVWIGLYSNIEWKWSDGYSGADYRHWAPEEPNFYSSAQYCVKAEDTGHWSDEKCSMKYNFICNTVNIKGKPLESDPDYILIPEEKDWESAQKFCRDNFIDLATVKHEADNQKVSVMIASISTVGWIGLYRESSFRWSDGSGMIYAYMSNVDNPLGNMTVVCGAANFQKWGEWKVLPCEKRLPFVCQGKHVPAPQTSVTKHVLKLKIKQKDSSVDLNDPAVNADILKKLQDKLKEDGLSEVTLKWRTQPDGKVFHKERKCSKMENSETPASEDEMSQYHCDL